MVSLDLTALICFTIQTEGYLSVTDFLNYNDFFCQQVRVGNDEYIHIRVFRSLQQEYSLASYQLDKALDDPITYF